MTWDMAFGKQEKKEKSFKFFNSSYYIGASTASVVS